MTVGHDDPIGDDLDGLPPWRLWLAGAAAVAAAALLVGLVLLVSASNRDRDADLTRERQSYDTVIIARALDAGMARAEAALGRFVISGDRDTGVIYYREWQRAGRLLARLKHLTAANPDQAARVSELSALYRTRSGELAAPALRATYRQGWTALSMFNDAGNAPSIARINALLDRVAEEERGMLAARAQTSARSGERANTLAWLLSLLGLLLAVGAAGLAWAVIHAIGQGRLSDRAARFAADRAGLLEQAVADRTRELRETNAALRDEAETRAGAEAQLRQAQKMEAVGQLTGGIAHDFNNMLAVVVGGLDLAKRRLALNPQDAGRHIDNAMEGANRAAALTRRLLAFARAQPLLPELIAPATLIAGMSDLMDRTLGERIRVETQLAGSSWRIWCDPGQLENGILNLAVNARDAMDGEGRLTITIGDVTLRDGEVGEISGGDYVRIAVTDDGCGMTPEVMERVFEPFFTTKPTGKGTGLGLSQVFGFARQSDGEVAIASALGAGTTISIYLPRGHAGDAPPPDDSAAPPAQAKEASAVILVVEDDARVRAATMEALAELGHAPLGASGGIEALEMLDARRDIRLILTDVVMPEMTGPELISRAAPLYPHVGVLYVTGYAGEAADGGKLAGCDVLRKPFTIAALDRATATVLAVGSSPPIARA
ncbi:MAG: sensor histidine kinase [Sphingomonas bacterium]|nr:ATP-binding protein [Sphingomonas bacterium]MDB5688862.1 sensor histidine kinase [Sphingomonas bacterium]